SDPDWRALPPAAAPLASVLRRCLEKDSKRRLRDIGDVKLLMEDAFSRADAAVTAPAPAATRVWRSAIAAALGLIAGGMAVTFLVRQRIDTLPARVERFERAASPADPLSADTYGGNIAISP